MPRHTQILSSALALITSAILSPAAAQTMCAPSTLTATYVLEKYASIIAATDPEQSALRDSLRLRYAASSDVRIDTNPALCDSAAVAYHRVLADDNDPPSPVWVIDAGPTRYIVFNIAFSGRLGTTLAVFDQDFQSLGGIAEGVGATSRRQGSFAPFPAPSNLHVVATAERRLDLTWSSVATDVSSFRVQRAVDSGSYAFLGVMLPPSTRTIADTTVQNGHSYRYRVVAYRSVTGVAVSNVVTTVVDNMGRTTKGLVFRDQFDRPDGELGLNWAVAAGAPFRILGGVARPPAAPTGADLARVTDSAMTPRASMCFQTQMTSLTRLGSPMMWSQLTSGAAPSGWLAFMGGEAGNAVQLYSVVNGNGQLVATTAGGLFPQNVPQSFKLCTGPGAQRVWLNDQLVINLTSTVLDGVAGTVGLRDGGTSADQGSWDDAIVTTSNTVTVTGLPVGYKLRVGTLTSDAATTSGAVTFDVQGAKFPIAQIDVLDAGGNVVTQIAPTGGILGGDEFTFTRS